MTQPKSIPELTLDVLLRLNDNLDEIKSLASGRAEPATKGKPAKATDVEWAQRLERNKAAGRMETARFYCPAPGCVYACWNEPKIDGHVEKRGAPHAKASV